MFKSSLASPMQIAFPPATFALWNRSLVCLLCVVPFAGCRQGQVFDPTEELPAYPGVSSQLRILEGQEKIDVLEIRLKEFDEDRAVVVQQVIENNTDKTIHLYQTPRFQAEQIVVKSANGRRVPLTAQGRDIKYSRPAGVATEGADPHETETRAVILTRLFDLSEPGKYTVEIESRYIITDKQPQGDSGEGPKTTKFFETDPEPITFEVK